MTRLLTCGWETGDINESGVTTIGTSNNTVTVVNSTPTPRSPGVYCLKLTATGTTSWQSYKAFTVAAAKTDIWVRFAIYIHSAGSTGESTIGGTLDSVGMAVNCINWDPSSNVMYLRQGNGFGGTLLATSTGTLTPDVWRLIDWRTQITNASSGVTEVWVDGTRIINFSGDNSYFAALNNVQTVRLGLTTINGNSPSGAYFAFDDIAINDTNGTINNSQIGDGRVVLLKPNGAGSNTNQTRGGTDSGANWSQVDEMPPALTDYVYATTAGTRDTYALENIPAGVTGWPINNIEVVAYAQKSDALAGSLAPTVVSGATTDEGAATALTTSPSYVRQQYETDPNTSAAWTAAALNALEAGTTAR